MNTRDAARRWADTWQRSWIANKPEPIIALYADSATYATAPFREPQVGKSGARDYLLPVLAAQKDVRAWFGEPMVDGERASVAWWAIATEEGQPITYAGVSLLRFDADGLVIDEWDAWNMLEGERAPPPGWGAAG
jgi:hypothetical protein